MVIKRLILLFIILISLFSFSSVVAADNDITLVVNGKKIETDVNPIIVNNRTLVPVRALFNAFNADVVWNDVFRQVVVTTEYSVIIFTIDSNIAYVNGYSKKLDAPASIVDGRTLVPVRFVSEALGYEVDWYASKRIIYINRQVNQEQDITETQSPPTSQDKPDQPTESNNGQTVSYDINLNSITLTTGKDKAVIKVNLSKKISPKVMILSSPDRIVVDFPNVNQICNDGKNEFKDYDIKAVRWATHGDYTRLVVESISKLKYNLDSSSNQIVLTVYVNETSSSEPDTSVVPDDSGNATLPGNTSAPVVVIDAGHGGNDCGAVGRDSNGNVVVYEANVNLDIALRIQSKLKSKGINVIMTRTKDVSLGSSVMDDLVKRADIANKANADLFVSVHNNSYSDPEATGTTVLYAGLSNSGGYGISSEQLARNIQKHLVKATGLKDRGITRSPGMVVLKRTDMPAALLECGFVSSYNDQKVLTDNNKLNDIADAVTNGIMDSLKNMGKIK